MLSTSSEMMILLSFSVAVQTLKGPFIFYEVGGAGGI